MPAAGCVPVRRFTWRQRQRHRPGLQFMVSTGRLHGFESLEERSLLLALDFTGTVEEVLSQPFRLKFETAGGDSGEHIPDFLAVFRDGSRWLLDVRPAGLVELEDAIRFAAAAEAALEAGWRRRHGQRHRDRLRRRTGHLMSGPAGREAREPAAYPGLLAALMAAVRPRFRGEVLGFDARDPVFGGPPCLVDGCERPGRNRGLCVWHYGQWCARKPDFAEFVATADPEWRPRSTPTACQVPGCEYAGQALGLCEGHYKRYLRAGRPDSSAWIAAGPPVTPPDPLATCLVPACGLWICGGSAFCHAHASAWKLHDRPDPSGFAAGYGGEAKLGRDRISLRALPPQLRLEWQYAFQARSDAGRQKVNPVEAQRAVNFTAGAGVTSLLDWDESVRHEAACCE